MDHDRTSLASSTSNLLPFDRSPLLTVRPISWYRLENSTRSSFVLAKASTYGCWTRQTQHSAGIGWQWLGLSASFMKSRAFNSSLLLGNRTFHFGRNRKMEEKSIGTVIIDIDQSNLWSVYRKHGRSRTLDGLRDKKWSYGCYNWFRSSRYTSFSHGNWVDIIEPFNAGNLSASIFYNNDQVWLLMHLRIYAQTYWRHLRSLNLKLSVPFHERLASVRGMFLKFSFRHPFTSMFDKKIFTGMH